MRGLLAATAALALVSGVTAQEFALEEDSLPEEDVLGEPELESQSPTYLQRSRAVLRALDKITGRSTDFEIMVGEPKVFGSLRIDLQVCYQTPPEEPPESAVFLQVMTAATKQVQTMAVPRDLTPEEIALTEGEDAEMPFSGWMFASSPGLNALEHPVYDIWVISCSASDPVTPSVGIE